jgi:SAM-dependent methyltransferase
MHASRRDIFRQLLTALWLRPESALWYSHMLSAAQSLGAHALPSPSMEFGCMDGLNAFVLLGGHVDAEFDVFGEVNWSYDAHRKSTLADDYYDRTSSESEHLWRHNMGPHTRFGWGLDWKQSHIEKARRFGAHEQFVLWTPGQPFTMFADDHFMGIWAPNAYWMDDVDGLLREFARVTQPSGRIVAIVPDRCVLDHMLFAFARTIDENWAQDLDRGRYENALRSASGYETWLERIEAASLRVIAHDRFIPAVVGEMYEVGFRPMFAVFMNMYEKIRDHSPEALRELKRNWIEEVEFFASPFVDDECLARFGDEHLWHIFALQPNK